MQERHHLWGPSADQVDLMMQATAVRSMRSGDRNLTNGWSGAEDGRSAFARAWSVQLSEEVLVQWLWGRK